MARGSQTKKPVLAFLWSPELEEFFRSALRSQPAELKRDGMTLTVEVKGPLTIPVTSQILTEIGVEASPEKLELLRSAISAAAARYRNLKVYVRKKDSGFIVRIIPEERDAIITVRMPISLLTRLHEYCRRTGEDRSKAIRKAIEYFLNKEGI